MNGRGRRILGLLWQLVWPVIIYEAAAELSRLVLIRLWPGAGPEETALLSLGLAAVLTALLLGGFYRSLRKQEAEAERARPAVVWSLLAGIGSCLLLNHLMMLLPGYAGQVSTANQGLDSPFLLLQIVCTGLAVPFAEELVFRGMGFWRLRGEVSFQAAALASAIWFGLAHATLLQIIYACLTGLLLAFLMEHTRSLISAWLFHAGANGLAVWLTALGTPEWISGKPVWILAAAAAGGLLLIWSFHHILENKNSFRNKTREVERT